MSELGDVFAGGAEFVAEPTLTDVFRDFEAALWAQINAPDSPPDRREVAAAAAAELSRVQRNIATELEIDS